MSTEELEAKKEKEAERVKIWRKAQKKKWQR